MQMKAERGAGFTLLELLVAVAVLAVMSVLAYGGLRSVVDTRQHVELVSGQLAALQMTFTALARDIEQTIPRPVRDPYLGADAEPALRGEFQLAVAPLELTRSGWRNPASLERATIQRVAWRLEEGTLIRSFWSHPDRLSTTPAQEVAMLEEVAGVRLRYRGEEDQWLESWPPAGSEDPAGLPRAVEVEIDVARWGSVTRLFVVGR